MSRKALLYLFCALTISVLGQSRKRSFRQREIGVFGGASYYIGDINPRKHFIFSKPAAGVFFRYSTNYRYAFRFSLNYGNIHGNDALSGEADQLERNLNFRSRIYEGSTVAEFNFLDYRIGQDKYNHSLYVFAGLGFFYFDPKSNIGDGYVSLRNFRTEGQGKAYPKFQVSVPFGIGFKWSISEKWGMSVEWGPRKTYTDFLDDVSGSYPELSEGSTGPFTDRTLNGSASTGSMRGNPSSKDWYFFYGVTLQFRFNEPSPGCHIPGYQKGRR